MPFRRFFLAALSFTLVSLPLPGSAAEARLARDPAPAPDGTTILFSWQGDLWSVPASGGTARRLTANPALERHPVWSRDGSQVAFASDRHGNLDVFLMPADGSRAPTRLTFASADDIPLDFTPDGTAVLFASRRDESIRRMPALYTVPVNGGTPTLAQNALAHSAAYAPSGTALAYVRGGSPWTRRGYHGAANRDVWLRTADGDDVRLTDFDGDDDMPSWIDNHTLAILSARNGRKNVFRFDLVTREALALTSHDGSDVRAPRASRDGSIIAYEFEDGLWVVSSRGSEPRQLEIDVPADTLDLQVEHVAKTLDADELAISPDEAFAAFIVHGDVFVTAVRSKEDQEIAAAPTVRVTTTPEREADVSWAPDGSALLFTSWRSGNADLYLSRPAHGRAWTESFEFSAEQLTDDPADEHAAAFSPSGDRIAFVRGRGDLVTMARDGSDRKVLLQHWSEPDFRWSPDGRWLAYSIPDMSYNTEVWIVPAVGGEPYNVSRHPDDDIEPRWSPDGRRLIWSTKRHGGSLDVWGVWLTRADDERTPEQWLKVWQAEPTSAPDGRTARDAKRKLPQSSDKTSAAKMDSRNPVTVAIDFDRLWERSRPITELLGDEHRGLISPDGRSVVFSAEPEGERDLYAVRWDGKELKRLTTGGQEPQAVQFDAKGENLFYLDRKGAVKKVGLDGKAGDPVPFEARYDLDRPAEREAVFDQAWRAIEVNFYDPKFDGVDWSAVRDAYRPWALEASTDADFADVMNLMLGELNASHMGYRPRRKDDGDRTGWIGALFDPTAGGPGLLVREVLPDSPAAQVDVAVVPGERVVAVSGRALEANRNINELLVDTVGRRIPVTILGRDGKERQVAVVPISGRDGLQLRYEEWVRERRRIVEERSHGRLGYVHIQGMNIPSFETFERGLYSAAHGREGLIIDVRTNGGGWTTDYLLTVLEVRRHAFTVPRGGDPDVRAYPQNRLPLAAWTRPALTVCNEESYSNAEIFSHAFKTLDRGLLVGTPTFGAVISTGAASLLNGALVRLPGRGWYIAGSGANMELHGAVPDVIVEQPPGEDTAVDHDAQLEKAVDVFLAGIEKDPHYGAW